MTTTKPTWPTDPGAYYVQTIRDPSGRVNSGPGPVTAIRVCAMRVLHDPVLATYEGSAMESLLDEAARMENRRNPRAVAFPRDNSIITAALARHFHALASLDDPSREPVGDVLRRKAPEPVLDGLPEAGTREGLLLAAGAKLVEVLDTARGVLEPDPTDPTDANTIWDREAEAALDAWRSLVQRVTDPETEEEPEPQASTSPVGDWLATLEARARVAVPLDAPIISQEVARDLEAALRHVLRWHDQIGPADVARMKTVLAKVEG